MNDLRQLRHFVALAEHGHFARAAESVNLSQPALSRSIQALEASLGCRLLDRGPRNAVLTAYGQLVLEHARRLLAASRSLQNAVNQLGNLEAGELRLGAGPYPAARLVPRALGQLARLYPKVRVQLLIEDWRNLRERLLNEAIELFVADTRELCDDPQLTVEPLQTHTGVLFCRPGHPLLQQSDLSIQALADYPLAGTQMPEQVTDSLRQLSGREHLLGIQCDNFMVLKALVAESDVLSMAPWDVIAEDVEAGRLGLVPMRPGELAQRSAYGLVSRAGHSLSPAAQAMLEQLRKEDAALPALAD
ncbi:MAG: LysR family transcriptional regulator [Pseudomonas sp.]